MAWRIHKSVICGEIDNRVRGRITGWLHLAGLDDKIVLELEGNCHRDIAGCKISLRNPAPERGNLEGMNSRQRGSAGELTASRKVRIVPERKQGESWDEYIARARASRKVGNAVYLEWFSDSNGRVVIESGDFQVTVLESRWRMSESDHESQCQTKRDAMSDWMEELCEGYSADEDEYDEDDADESEAFDPEDDEPMNEFEWEQFLREADERADRYVQLVEKYMDHPQGDRIIAREMGWNWIREEIEDVEESGDREEHELWTDAADIDPNPLTEGVDWIRDKDGHITHPLTGRLHELTLAMWHACKEQGLMDEPGDRDLHEMLFQLHTASAKLAGALDGLAFDEAPEGGFVVACLKRSLVFLHNGISASTLVGDKELIEPESLRKFRASLFSIREDILRLMEHYRHWKY
jgi:hypothetical protein